MSVVNNFPFNTANPLFFSKEYSYEDYPGAYTTFSPGEGLEIKKIVMTPILYGSPYPLMGALNIRQKNNPTLYYFFVGYLCDSCHEVMIVSEKVRREDDLRVVLYHHCMKADRHS